jgi:hypothetical protein
MTPEAYKELRINTMEFVRLRYTSALTKVLGPDRARVLEQTLAYIHSQADISAHAAETLAAQTIGEYESAKHSVCIDVDRSTSYVVFVNDHRSGRTLVVSAKALVNYLDTINLLEARRSLMPVQAGTTQQAAH